jgi:hypothetical protein
MLAALRGALAVATEIADATQLYIWGLDRELLALRGGLAAHVPAAPARLRTGGAEAT